MRASPCRAAGSPPAAVSRGGLATEGRLSLMEGPLATVEERASLLGPMVGRASCADAGGFLATCSTTQTSNEDGFIWLRPM